MPFGYCSTAVRRSRMQTRVASAACGFLRTGISGFRLLNANRPNVCPFNRPSLFLSRRGMAGAKPTKRVTRSAAKAATAQAISKQDPSGTSDEAAKEAVDAIESSVKPTTNTAKSSRKRKVPEKRRSPRAKKVTKSSDEQSVKESSTNAPDAATANEADEVVKAPKKRKVAATKKTPRAKKGAKSAKTAAEKDPGKGSAVAADAVEEIIESTCNVEWGACDNEFIKIVTWNICSCRTVLKNGALLDYLNREDPDILLVQETKMSEDRVKEFPELDTHDVYWNHSTAKKGYSGIAVICSKELLKGKGLSVESVTPGMGNAEADAEGRVLTLVLSNDIAIVNAYVPNAGGKLARLPYRTETFEPEMRAFLDKLRQKHRRVVYSGDLNVAHHPIDIHESKRNEKSAGHTPQERAEMTKMLNDDKWRDVWRELHPRTRGYTYFSRRFGDRLKLQNKGWRLDYHIMSDFEDGEVKDCYIRYDQVGSDHVPTVLVLRHDVKSS